MAEGVLGDLLLLSQESQGPFLGSSSLVIPRDEPRAWLDVGCDGSDGLGDLGLDGGDVFPGRNSPAWELPWIQGGGAHSALP